jgi:glutaredoxin 2
MNISKELKDHFSKLPKFKTSDGITFYSQKDYDTYMKLQEDIKECSDIIKRLNEKIDDDVDDTPSPH